MTYAYLSPPEHLFANACSLLEEYPIGSKCLMWVNYDLISQQNQFRMCYKLDDKYMVSDQSFFTDLTIEWDTALPEALERFDALQDAIERSYFAEFRVQFNNPTVEFDNSEEKYHYDDEGYNEDDQYDADVSYNPYTVSPWDNEPVAHPVTHPDYIESLFDQFHTSLTDMESEEERERAESIFFANMKNILHTNKALQSQQLLVNSDNEEYDNEDEEEDLDDDYQSDYEKDEGDEKYDEE